MSGLPPRGPVDWGQSQTLQNCFFGAITLRQRSHREGYLHRTGMCEGLAELGRGRAFRAGGKYASRDVCHMALLLDSYVPQYSAAAEASVDLGAQPRRDPRLENHTK